MMPSATLLGQSVVSGLLAGGLYALLALGLSLSWGLLRLVNLAHFALALLGAYLTYQLGHVFHVPPWIAVALIVPAFFVLGVALHVVFSYFKVTEFTSLLVTFGLAVIIESLIQWFWTADYRRYETPYTSLSMRVGPLFVPVLELLACLAAAALALGTWAWLRFTYVGKALRASAEDPAIAGAFGVNHRRHAFLLSGVAAAYAGVAGTFIALISTLAPTQIWAWLGVVFAVVIIGGLGNPAGALLAGFLIGVSESVTMAVAAPAWAPLVSFSILILVLVLRPDRA
jgi:branched-chain amino acid transport system permease protein